MICSSNFFAQNYKKIELCHSSPYGLMSFKRGIIEIEQEI